MLAVLERFDAETARTADSGSASDKSRISFVIGDITQMNADAIVNAANKSLLGGSGVDGAIHRAAGPDLLEECRKLHGCNTGEAKITGGYRLKAKYVIHTVGPVYNARDLQCETLLHACYVHSLDLAKQYHLHSVAFPAISTGVYGYPKKEAAAVALAAISEWLSAHPDYSMDVIIVCYDAEMYGVYQSQARFE
ncbi:MAG: O-acetyl-ADP-ribose deacetylase [Oscillospiraceae bacterium]|nr:O-acetyl-ADP-ribose deacetylase [Oscillospiraceae bacterium]